MSLLAYIDSDEEIISVISRLRKASDREIFFVVPKRALFVQSLVNLRLLDREAKKLGKKLCLVAPDEESLNLVRKSGIESRSSLEGVQGMGQPPRPPLPARLPETPPSAGIGSNPTEATPIAADGASLPRSESIGSSSFFMVDESILPVRSFGEKGKAVSLRESVNPPVLSNGGPSPASTVSRSIPVRDRTPKRMTALNSATVPYAFQPKPESQAPSTSVESPEVADRANPLDSQVLGRPRPLNFSGAPVQDRKPSAPYGSDSGEGSASVGFDREAISRFYRKPASNTMPVRASVPRSDVGKHSGSNTFHWILFGGVALSIVAIVGVALAIFLPHADVTVVAKEISSSTDVEVLAKTDQSVVDVKGKLIPLRVVETEKDIVKSFPSTGQSSVSDSRARGVVTFSNSFGSDPQFLVATTRIESPDGKIFRLTKGVTIPGMKNEGGESVPGTVEAEVMADASGSGYNVDPTTFTIPGLKGSPKYDKIKVSSSKSFTGGDGQGNSIASVSADDVVRAKEDSLKALPDALRAELEKDLRPGEKLLDDAILSETLSADPSPGVGSVAASFDFRIHVSVRALIFSENDLRTVAAASLGSEAKPDQLHIEYTVPHPDFTAKSLGIKARVSFDKKQDIDTEAIKKSLLGKSMEDVQSALADYRNIQKIEVVFWPRFMTSRIPSRPSQVSITVKTVSDKSGGM